KMREEAERMSKAPCEGERKQHAQNRLLTLMGGALASGAVMRREAQLRGAVVRSGVASFAAPKDMEAADIRCHRSVASRLTFSEAKKMPHDSRVPTGQGVAEMSMSQEQFVDLCILLGCDYATRFAASAKKALEFLRKYAISTIVSSIWTRTNIKELAIPGARRLFAKPDVTPGDTVELKWSEPDEAGLIKFLVEENGFNEERVRSGAKRLLKAKQTTVQGRIDSFFSVLQPPAGQQSLPAARNGSPWPRLARARPLRRRLQETRLLKKR
uniref:XPGI domain-containing protein n=1 Tax=Macrostomum lignano TaxID=282301 RepID=A0A1I8FBN3_9PLAT